jgi:hypothetical protein
LKNFSQISGVDLPPTEIRFDAEQAKQIALFFSQVSYAASFRLMPDHFNKYLDLTAYDKDGKEITHVHPRPKDYWDAAR